MGLLLNKMHIYLNTLHDPQRGKNPKLSCPQYLRIPDYMVRNRFRAYLTFLGRIRPLVYSIQKTVIETNKLYIYVVSGSEITAHFIRIRIGSCFSYVSSGSRLSEIIKAATLVPH